jgi:hypothetical protein
MEETSTYLCGDWSEAFATSHSLFPVPRLLWIEADQSDGYCPSNAVSREYLVCLLVLASLSARLVGIQKSADPAHQDL